MGGFNEPRIHAGTHSSANYNVGDNTVYTGGSMASHLLLPVIPR